jgi:hypothetical protein
MAVILQVHFPFKGPFGDEMAEALADLAHSINEEPGFKWKIWTEASSHALAGGIYLFTDHASAEAYREKHTSRLKGMGVDEIETKLFAVNPALTAINHGPV